jgi:excisionase family DNA binding protein
MDIKSPMLRDAVQRLATRQEVAEYLGVPATTLAQWAHRGKGPEYIRVGRHCRYDFRSVTRWLDEQAKGGQGAA